MSLLTSVGCATFVVALGAASAAQQPAGQMPPMPKPGPEHAALKADVGSWDAVVEFIPGPGAPPMTSKGVETNTMGCNGMCLISDFKGEAMGAPFQGHGVMAWDPAKKKYIGSWTDSMSLGLATTEATYDAATKKWSGTMEGPDMTGQVMKTRSEVTWPTPNSRVMTAWATGPDGKEAQVMKITYTRKK